LDAKLWQANIITTVSARDCSSSQHISLSIHSSKFTTSAGGDQRQRTGMRA